MTSRNQDLSPNDKGRQRRESLGTRLGKSHNSRDVIIFEKISLKKGFLSTL